MAEDKKYVDNDVFVFSVYLNRGFDSIEKTIYTKPLMEDAVDKEVELRRQEAKDPNADFEDDVMWEAMKDYEKKVQDKYFTPERIEELKKEFCRRIMESENPFMISCTDTDGGYNVTEDELFDIGE